MMQNSTSAPVEKDLSQVIKIERAHPYACLDGISLKRTSGGEVRNVAVLATVSVGEGSRWGTRRYMEHGATERTQTGTAAGVN